MNSLSTIADPMSIKYLQQMQLLKDILNSGSQAINISEADVEVEKNIFSNSEFALKIVASPATAGEISVIDPYATDNQVTYPIIAGHTAKGASHLFVATNSVSAVPVALEKFIVPGSTLQNLQSCVNTGFFSPEISAESPVVGGIRSVPVTFSFTYAGATTIITYKQVGSEDIQRDGNTLYVTSVDTGAVGSSGCSLQLLTVSFTVDSSGQTPVITALVKYASKK
jgi:hypothetical protein